MFWNHNDEYTQDDFKREEKLYYQSLNKNKSQCNFCCC